MGRMEWQIIRDGNGWWALGPDFETLEKSPAGWGHTPDEARAALAARYLEHSEPLNVPQLSDFRVHA